MLEFFKTLGLFVATALAEIIGCYLPYLWLKQDKSVWLLVPAAASLAIFAWLLTLHPAAAGRVYAAYGGVYISVVNRPGFCRQSRASYFLSNRSPYEQSTLPRRIQDRGGQTNP